MFRTKKKLRMEIERLENKLVRLKGENLDLKMLFLKRREPSENTKHNCDVLCKGCEHYIETLSEHGCALDRECKDYSKRGGK